MGPISFGARPSIPIAETQPQACTSCRFQVCAASSLSFFEFPSDLLVAISAFLTFLPHASLRSTVAALLTSLPVARCPILAPSSTSTLHPGFCLTRLALEVQP